MSNASIYEAYAWQSRSLEVLHPIVYLDYIRFKSGEDGVVKVNAVYLVLGIDFYRLKAVAGILDRLN